MLPAACGLGKNNFKLLMLKAPSSPSILMGHLDSISVGLHLLPGVIAQMIHFSRALKPKGKAEGSTLIRVIPKAAFCGFGMCCPSEHILRVVIAFPFGGV